MFLNIASHYRGISIPSGDAYTPSDYILYLSPNNFSLGDTPQPPFYPTVPRQIGQVVNSSTAYNNRTPVKGDNFFQYHWTAANYGDSSMQNALAYAAYQNMPYTFTEGETLYTAWYERFYPIAGTAIFTFTPATYGGDKGIELNGDIRWIASRGVGDGWGFSGLTETQFTTWLGNPNWHYNRTGNPNYADYTVETASDVIRPNQNGYSMSNPFVMEYDKWYSRVMAIKLSSNYNDGRIRHWINGILTTDWDLVKTCDASTGVIQYCEWGG